MAGVPAHHLDDHHPVVRLRGRVQPIDGVDAHLHGGVEPEGELGGRQIVVDGLRHADDGDAFVVEPAGDAQGVLAADGDERVDTVIGKCLLHPVDAAIDLVRVRARRAEDGAAARQRTPHPLDVESDREILHDAFPAVAEADQLIAVVDGRLADRCA